LLDESQLDYYVQMPNVNADQVDLQKAIGMKIVVKENINLHEDAQNKVNDSFYKIVDKDSIEVIDAYRDRCPGLGLRKCIMKTRIYINRSAIAIVSHKAFESISIFVIVINSVFLALSDPTTTITPVY
jgi:hypothetical protein